MQISLRRNVDQLAIALRGDVNEASTDQLADLSGKIEVGRVEFDVSGIELINSFGARAWITFAQGLRRRKVVLTFVNCAVEFIEASNMYVSFVAPSEVASFQLPLQCMSCGVSKRVVCHRSQVNEGPTLPSQNCERCKTPMKLEVDPETYLAFLEIA